MKRTMNRVLSVMLALSVCLIFAGCGMTKEKAIEKLGEALLQNSVIDSGKMEAQMDMTVELGADSIPMKINMSGSFKDKMQTMAMKMSGEMMGNPIDTETYQLDGFSYTLDNESGKYIKQQSPTAMMDYQQLVTLNQSEMTEIYVEGAKAAEDFKFAEEEKGLRVSFTMPKEQLDKMQQTISDMMLDKLIPSMEEQMRSTMEEQVKSMLGGMEMDEEQLKALVDQQIKMVIELEKQLFSSLEINMISCDMLITDGVINDQTLGMEMQFDIKSLVETLGATDTENIPEACKMTMEIHSLIENRNEDVEIEMPEFSEENILTIG